MKNQIYYGDNLDVLRNHITSESIDLCYIDPPFNSNRDYSQIYLNIGKEKENAAQAQAFIDTWTWNDGAIKGLTEIKANIDGTLTPQSIDLIKGLESVLGKGSLLAYLVSMTLRIAQIHRVLKPTGSFYLHCDPTASHYLKLVLDALFCSRGGKYLNEITWKRKTGRGETNHKSNRFGVCTDIIFFYAKSKNNVFNTQFNFDAKGYKDYVDKFFKHTDENGRIYRIADLSSPSPRANLMYEYKGYQPPKNGWAISKEKMELWDKEGRLHFPSDPNGRIQRRRFLNELKGKPVQNLWDDIEMISSQAAERLGYDTQKPEALLERIIQASSNEGDMILDAYCGCGTTIAVAHRLKRHWIGIDITYQSISLILKRLEDTFTQDFNQSVLNKDSAKTFEKIEISGVPKDFESAKALAEREDDKTRKEFEKWMVLSYSKNRAMINDKKGGDKGIDGIAYIADRIENGTVETAKVIFSVKSNKNVTQAMLRELLGTVEREKAACGFLLTLYPMPALKKESKSLGEYVNSLTGNAYPKIQVICVDDLLNGAAMNLPNPIEVVKKAQQDTGKQINVF